MAGGSALGYGLPERETYCIFPFGETLAFLAFIRNIPLPFVKQHVLHRLESQRDVPAANKVCGLYPFSPERETCCILSVNQLLHACLLTKWKKCNILSLFLQIHIVESTIPRRSSVPLSLQKGAAYGMLPICKAFVCLPFYKRLFHIPLQSSWGGVRGL